MSAFAGFTMNGVAVAATVAASAATHSHSEMMLPAATAPSSACANFEAIPGFNVLTAELPDGYTAVYPSTGDVDHCCDECTADSDADFLPCFAFVTSIHHPEICYMKRGEPDPGSMTRNVSYMTAYVLRQHPPSPPAAPPRIINWDEVPLFYIPMAILAFLLLVCCLALCCGCVCYQCALRKMSARRDEEPVLSVQQRRELRDLTFETLMIGYDTPDAEAPMANMGRFVDLQTVPSGRVRTLHDLLGVGSRHARRNVRRHVDAIREELRDYIEGAPTEMRELAVAAQAQLEYVLHGEASMPGIDGFGVVTARFADFLSDAQARAPDLHDYHVAALRWYTCPEAYTLINEPLRANAQRLRARQRAYQHPLVACVIFLDEAIKLLARSEAPHLYGGASIRNGSLRGSRSSKPQSSGSSIKSTISPPLTRVASREPPGEPPAAARTDIASASPPPPLQPRSPEIERALLQAAAAHVPTGPAAGAQGGTPPIFWRGMKNVSLSDAFRRARIIWREGTVEPALMSTTTDLATAMRYSAKDGAMMRVVLKLVPDTPYELHVGADVAFLSLFPTEREVLFPPGVTLVPRAVEFVGLSSDADAQLPAWRRSCARILRRCKGGGADDRYSFFVLECRVSLPPLETMPLAAPRAVTASKESQTDEGGSSAGAGI